MTALSDDQKKRLFERAVEVKAEEIIDEQGDYTLRKAVESHIEHSGPRHHAHLVEGWGKPDNLSFELMNIDPDELSDEQIANLRDEAIDAKVNEINQEVHGEGSRYTLKKAIESHLEKTSVGYQIHLLGPERAAELLDVTVDELPIDN